MSLADARAGAFALGPYRAMVRYRRDGVPGELLVAVDPEVVAGGYVESGNADVLLTLHVEPAPEHEGETARSAVLVSPHVTARRSGIRLDEVEPFVLYGQGVPPRAIRFFHNGWQSWSGTSVLSGDAVQRRPPLAPLREVVDNPASPRALGPGQLISDLFTALAFEDGADEPAPDSGAVVLGYVRSASQFGCFALDCRRDDGPRLAARLPFDGVPLAPGETRAGEPLLVQWGEQRNVAGMLAAWADRLGREMRARTGAPRTVGWCSWYEYFTRIDEKAFADNLAAAHELRARLPIDLFQLDDGYQRAIGDWLEPNDKFPRGLAPLADEIRGLGFAPGLWLAPFIARPESRLAREHPGWLVRDAAGRRRRGVYNPMWGKADVAWALDVTHPGAAEWLHETCRTLAHDHGYGFLKLDFLFAAALPGRRRDPRCTGAEALRRGLEIVRDAVGDGVHLLGCGCPLGPAVGLVDSMRIGADVAPFWRDPISRGPGRDYDFPSTRNAIRNTLARSFLHGRLWRNDPDCLLVRDRRTRLRRDEVLALATAIAISGGTFLLSDELRTLAGERLEIAERALAVQADVEDEPPVCPDAMRPGTPRVTIARSRRGGAYLAVVNLEDRWDRLELDLSREPALAALVGAPPFTVRDVWTGEYWPVRGTRLELGRVPPHGARLLRIERRAVDPAAAPTSALRE